MQVLVLNKTQADCIISKKIINTVGEKILQDNIDIIPIRIKDGASGERYILPVDLFDKSEWYFFKNLISSDSEFKSITIEDVPQDDIEFFWIKPGQPFDRKDKIA